MPRPKKTTSSTENEGSQDLTSKTSRRKRTPSAEMAGLSRNSQSTSGKKRTAGRPRKTRDEKENEYTSPDKTRSYESDLIDDYYQEGARYASGGPSERGRTEFEYDREHQSRDPYWGAPRELGRQSYYNPGYTSDYRNRRSGSSDYSSEYMSGRGDVPSGGYYGYRRMQERGDFYNDPQSRSRRSESDWDRRSDQPYYGSSREDERSFGRRSERGPAYGGAWHSDFNDDYQDYDRGYNQRSRYDDQHGYGMSSGRERDFDRYETRNEGRTFGNRDQDYNRESWQNWSPEEREMMHRRRGGYPKNISRNY